MSVAARRAGVPMSVVHAKRRIDKGFDDAVKTAISESVDALEHEGRRRAMGGGDRLLLEFLRAKRPEEFKRPEAQSQTQVTVNVDTLGLLQRLQERRLSGPTQQARDVTPARSPDGAEALLDE